MSVCDYKRQMCNSRETLPPIFALRLTVDGVLVLALDEDPHQPRWHCVARLALPRAPAGEVIQLKRVRDSW